MKTKAVALGLAGAVCLQLVVLAGEYLSAQLPLWTGKEVRIKTLPVDPRSMFRGNYALLNYDISLIDAGDLPGSEDLRNGEVVFVKLRADEKGDYIYAGASLQRPAEGVFLRGRLANRRYHDRRHKLRIKYGIEAYFAPREKAQAMEKVLRRQAVSVLMVADNGRAALKAVVVE